MEPTTLSDEVREYRSPEYEIAPLILNRWSRRAMTGEQLAESELMPLFEAARWAPSSRNNQPWRYRYATAASAEWDAFFALLSEGNQRWAENAAALVVVLSETVYPDSAESIRNHSFTTGASWQNLALEGTRRGLVVHPMQGFDVEAARQTLNVPDDVNVEIMTAIGVPGERDDLTDRDREREYPSDRRPLQMIVAEGAFE